MATCVPVLNLQHGEIEIRSGDTVPLVKTVEFDEGDFAMDYTKNLNVVMHRGKRRDVTHGEESVLKWSFSAKWRDETLLRTLDQLIWDAQSETITSITSDSAYPITLTYDYEQNSLQPASGETGILTAQKQAPGVAPTAPTQFSETLGVVDSEDVVVVDKVSGATVWTPDGDEDVVVTYDAVGKSTEPTVDCPLSVKTFKLILKKFDPLNPLTVIKSYVLNHAIIESFGAAEDALADKITFSGLAFAKRFVVFDGVAP